MVKYTLEFCPREQIKACITHNSTLGRGQHKMPASLLDVHCYRPTEHSSFPFSAPPPMPSIPHCHVHMWALAAAGVLCQSHPRALARKAARHQAAWSQGTACVPHHICQRWISFQQHWAKKWQLHGLSCGMLSAFILKFNFLVPGCALFFVFLFVSLFAVSLLLLGQIRRKGIGRAVRKAQLFHPLQLSSAAPQRTTMFLTCNKRQQRCNAVPGEGTEMSLGKQGVASCIFHRQPSLRCPGFYHFVGLSMICQGEQWLSILPHSPAPPLLPPTRSRRPERCIAEPKHGAEPSYLCYLSHQQRPIKSSSVSRDEWEGAGIIKSKDHSRLQAAAANYLSAVHGPSCS